MATRCFCPPESDAPFWPRTWLRVGFGLGLGLGLGLGSVFGSGSGSVLVLVLGHRGPWRVWLGFEVGSVLGPE